MRKLLVLADDFTGGLDTGAQFAAAGIPTVVTTNPAYCAADHEEDTVLVVDVETRHLPPQKARQIVEQTVRAAIAHGFTDIYKKTDSALRGNLGAELQGVLDGTGQTRLHLIPAFPEMGRTTKDGVQLIDGVPVAQSVFGKDPFEPVRHSKIQEILAEQCTCAVQNVGKHMPQEFSGAPCIYVYDAETRADVAHIAAELKRAGSSHIYAGCAGFAALLPELLELDGRPPVVPVLEGRLVVACGSMNPITLAQMKQLEGRCSYIHIPETLKFHPAQLDAPAGQKQLDAWAALAKQSQVFVLDTNPKDAKLEPPAEASMDRDRKTVAGALAGILHALLQRGVDGTIMITGGDCLFAFLQELQIDRICPLCEIQPGVVVSRLQYGGNDHFLLSKSGGFGKENLFEQILAAMQESSLPEQSRQKQPCISRN